MFSLFENFIFFLRVFVIFFLLFYLLPSRIFKHDKTKHEFGTLDRFFIYFTHSNLVTILIVYTLALAGIYETISLLIAYFLIFLIYVWRKKKKEGIRFSDLGMHYFGKFLDSSEEAGGMRKSIFSSVKNFFKKIGECIKDFFNKLISRPVESILLLAALLFGAYVRFHHSFAHLYYGSSDPYVHLAWTKYIGNNQLFVDGVYPHGYHAIISAMSKIFFTDPSVIIRFIGPMSILVMIVSIYYVLRKQIRTSLIPAVAGVIIYLLNTDFPFGQIRHISALPEEYAMIFMLPGIYFITMFFKTEKKYFLLLSAEAILITILVHPYTTVYMAVGYLLIALFHFRVLFKPKNLFITVGSMLAAVIVGLIPIGAGLLWGKDFHGASIDFIRDSIDTDIRPMQFNEIVRYMTQDSIFTVLFICLAVLFVFSLIRLFLKSEDHRENAKIGVIFTLFTLLLYFQYRAPDFGIPSVMDFTRTSSFLGFIAAFAFALVIGSFDLITSKKYIGNILKTIAAAVIIFMLFDPMSIMVPIKAPMSDRMEYDEAAYASLKIKEDYQLNNWTVISPVEQYPESINYGYHYNIWEYVKTMDEDGEEIEFPTEYVFWFVEKIPLNQEEEISVEDAEKPFPEITGNLDEYYTIPENRRIIQAKAYLILEELLAKEENMSVYMETEYMKIYVLRQEKFAVDMSDLMARRSMSCERSF